MKRRWLTLFALLLAALWCGPLAPPVAGQQATPVNSYAVVDLGHLGGGSSTAYGINDSGQVAGGSYALVGGVPVYRAFLWSGGVLTDLGTLGGTQSQANALNDRGQVVGWANTAGAGGASHAFLWDAASGMRDLGTLGGTFSWANGINDAGQVVGTADNAAGVRRAFLWQNGQMVDLGTLPGYGSSVATGVNASGQVVGYAADAYGQSRAFRWTPAVPNGATGTMAALHASNGNAAYAVSGSGDAAGESLRPWHFPGPTLWGSGGGAYELPFLSYMDYGSAFAIHDAIGVTGRNSYDYYYYDEYYGGYSYTESHAFLWDGANGTRDLAAMAGGVASFTEARGVNAAGQVAANGNGSTASLLNPSPAPPRPAYLLAGGGDGSVSLSWPASPSATGYTVKRSASGTAGGPFEPVASGVTATSWVDAAVSNGTAYYYVVSASNAWGEGMDSPVAGATPMPPPDAPTGLSATPGDQIVRLAWNAVADAGHYEVYRATTPGGPYDYVDYTYATEYTDYGDYWNGIPLENGTTYYYVVTAVAVNGVGRSAHSNEASATPTPPAPPPAPTGLAASGGDSLVSLTWNASPGATYYHVKRATTSGGPYLTTFDGYANGFTDHTVSNGTTYYYVVSAGNSGGESPDSGQVSATPSGPPPPAAPTGLTASGTGKRKIVLKWKQSASPGIVQNWVYRAATSGGPYSQVARIAPGGTSYTDSSIPSGTTYHYVVTAGDNRGKESAFSNQASATAR